MVTTDGSRPTMLRVCIMSMTIVAVSAFAPSSTLLPSQSSVVRSSPVTMIGAKFTAGSVKAAQKAADKRKAEAQKRALAAAAKQKAKAAAATKAALAKKKADEAAKAKRIAAAKNMKKTAANKPKTAARTPAKAGPGMKRSAIRNSGGTSSSFGIKNPFKF